MENCPGNINILLPKENSAPRRKSKPLPIGTGLSSTLLSSQRTTTHRKLPAYLRRPAPGHSLNFTLSSWPCQPVSPGSCRSYLAHPSSRCRGSLRRAASLRSRCSKDLAGRPVADLPDLYNSVSSCRLPRPFPCWLAKHYPLVSRAPNRPPVSPPTTR